MGQQKVITWFRRTCSVPAVTRRILVFSPEYPEDSEMRIRIIDGQFWQYAVDATHWAELPEDPES